MDSSLDGPSLLSRVEVFCHLVDYCFQNEKEKLPLDVTKTVLWAPTIKTPVTIGYRSTLHCRKELVAR